MSPSRFTKHSIKFSKSELSTKSPNSDHHLISNLLKVQNIKEPIMTSIVITELSQIFQNVYYLYPLLITQKSSQTSKPIRVLTIDFRSYQKSKSLIPHKSNYKLTPNLNFYLIFIFIFFQVSLVTPYYCYITSNMISNHQDSYLNNHNLKPSNSSNKLEKPSNEIFTNN